MAGGALQGFRALPVFQLLLAGGADQHVEKIFGDHGVDFTPNASFTAEVVEHAEDIPEFFIFIDRQFPPRRSLRSLRCKIST